MSLPSSVKYVIIGAGIHGLSTAYHLAQRLKASGRGSGADILVIDKTGIGGGASGIACGVVRNNYFQPAMRELMVHSVEVWESDPKAYSYHPVGYMQISPEVMHADVGTIYEQQKALGYESTFIEGAADCQKYMTGLFDDWQAQNITSVLHEKRGGYANNTASLYGLANKAEAEGVRIATGVEVLGFEYGSNSGAVTGVETDKGVIACETVVVGVGPWVNKVWDMLELPKAITIKGSDGTLHENVPMWKFWCLEEGTLGVDPEMHKTNDGKMPPVIHVDTDAPLYSDVDGSLITDQLWGLYYKPDFNFGGIQGGASPYKVDQDADNVAIDPYGPDSPDFIVGDDFIHMWCSMLAHCQKRFEGQIKHYKHKEKSGGLGCFTPDNFPVFDNFRENVYVIADSNHGYKMIGVGKLVAQELMGEKSALLEPFRFGRFAKGELHPVSHSPFPWS
ncbi:monomeric sarcosine oxidase [Methyloceanibacter superfactus]|jgi:glycine/D-amino acid oxidase-like deaminating enzyme|uniref:Monomeric sarcosine oxidase n=1 Tax=Methyloceanibacter superfactus TaxID=1774969 RepID=A0A1E3W728_9HYPH|nr:FAD-binding oxidoreductase [Methyloceanibacter superfactus]ODS01618.1 monomeric sarcosine oxidase [Methyloceanibacter superfactus]